MAEVARDRRRGGTPPALRVLEGQLRAYAKRWYGSAASTFVTPVLFLAAMGLGLGQLVDRGDALEGLGYLQFVATGLLAAQALQVAAADGAFPVMAGMKWLKTYSAALATPIRTRDLVLGHLAYVTLRLALAVVVYAVVIRLFGVTSLGAALLSTLPAILTGLAFATPIMAFAARLENDMAIATMFRFGVVPMFLFSGTFFPVSQLPDWLEPVAVLSALWHGVELTRALALDRPTPLPALVHLGVLVGVAGLGLVLTLRGFERRLVR
jgi:lipooligosaccharide transport system permease protein